MKKQFPNGLYGITAEKLSKDRSLTFVVDEMIKGGVKIIQYREKRDIHKTFAEIYSECLYLRAVTKENGIIFIVNDYVDIAMMVGADGVHIGQDDMPLKEVRKLVGDSMMIGLSTHSPDQALKAVKDGADYIGVGPIFQTNTKEDVCAPVTLGYLDWVVKNIDIPFVAIGGIKEQNIDEVLEKGAKTVAIVSDITGANSIYDKVFSIKNKISNYISL